MYKTQWHNVYTKHAIQLPKDKPTTLLKGVKREIRQKKYSSSLYGKTCFSKKLISLGYFFCNRLSAYQLKEQLSSHKKMLIIVIIYIVHI